MSDSLTVEQPLTKYSLLVDPLVGHVFTKFLTIFFVRWLQSVVPKMFDLKKEDFMHLLHKVLFLESADQYCNKDNWPPEADRSFMVSTLSKDEYFPNRFERHIF